MDQKLEKRKLAAWRAFLGAQSLVMDRIDRDLKAAGMPAMDWYDVLYTLYLAPDRRIRLHELASAVLISRSGLTRLVDRIEAAGYLRRENCPADRRGTYAVLTDEGVEILRTMWPVYRNGIVNHFAGYITKKEADVLAAALERMVAGRKPVEAEEGEG